jgi:G2/mitotic-specific cyclin 3/4
MAAKRTAFGDVSNTAKNIGTIYNDDAINKNTSDIAQKHTQPHGKPVGLLRPAQRPLTIASLKGLMGSSLNNPSAPIIIKGPVVEIQQQPLISKPRTLSKRATTIYKDPSSIELDQPSQVTSLSTLQNLVSVAPVHQNLDPRQNKSQPQLKEDHPALQQAQSKHIATSTEENQGGSIAVAPVDNSTTNHDIQAVRVETNIVSTSHEEHHDVVIQIREGNDKQTRELPPLPSTSDPEEYWDDEEEEEAYDEQGYATTHSYKSRSDNTTSGTTTVLFPKITNKVKKELAIAKESVESSRTADEIEDEAWDTSMVAEYGDEIFQYMRELEVSCLISHARSLSCFLHACS